MENAKKEGTEEDPLHALPTSPFFSTTASLPFARKAVGAVGLFVSFPSVSILNMSSEEDRDRGGDSEANAGGGGGSSFSIESLIRGNIGGRGPVSVGNGELTIVPKWVENKPLAIDGEASNGAKMEKDPPLLEGAECRLETRELWRRFFDLGTEMIITKTGRRMFPTVRCSFFNLSEQDLTYHVVLDIVPSDSKRYRYAYHRSSWLVAGKADPPPPHRFYVHPDGPFSAEQLERRQVISFEKVKLTNNEMDKSGQVVLNSMHKFQPRIHLVAASTTSASAKDSSRRNTSSSCLSDVEAAFSSPSERRHRSRTFSFQETAFMAVTAYQNQLITKLKIDSNPFAKGFRDSSRLAELERDNYDSLWENGVGVGPLHLHLRNPRRHHNHNQIVQSHTPPPQPPAIAPFLEVQTQKPGGECRDSEAEDDDRGKLKTDLKLIYYLNCYKHFQQQLQQHHPNEATATEEHQQQQSASAASLLPLFAALKQRQQEQQQQHQPLANLWNHWSSAIIQQQLLLAHLKRTQQEQEKQQEQEETSDANVGESCGLGQNAEDEMRSAASSSE